MNQSDFARTISSLKYLTKLHAERARDWLLVRPELAKSYEDIGSNNRKLAKVLERIGEDKNNQLTFIQKVLKENSNPENKTLSPLAANQHLLSGQKEIINAIRVIVESLPNKTLNQYLPK